MEPEAASPQLPATAGGGAPHPEADPVVLLVLKVPTFISSRECLSYEEFEDGLFGGIIPESVLLL